MRLSQNPCIATSVRISVQNCFKCVGADSRDGNAPWGGDCTKSAFVLKSSMHFCKSAIAVQNSTLLFCHGNFIHILFCDYFEKLHIRAYSHFLWHGTEGIPTRSEHTRCGNDLRLPLGGPVALLPRRTALRQPLLQPLHLLRVLSPAARHGADDGGEGRRSKRGKSWHWGTALIP